MKIFSANQRFEGASISGGGFLDKPWCEPAKTTTHRALKSALVEAVWPESRGVPRESGYPLDRGADFLRARTVTEGGTPWLVQFFSRNLTGATGELCHRTTAPKLTRRGKPQDRDVNAPRNEPALDSVVLKVPNRAPASLAMPKVRIDAKEARDHCESGATISELMTTFKIRLKASGAC